MERERERETGTDGRTDRQTDRDRDRLTDRDTDRLTDREDGSDSCWCFRPIIRCGHPKTTQTDRDVQAERQ